MDDHGLKISLKIQNSASNVIEKNINARTSLLATEMQLCAKKVYLHNQIVNKDHISYWVGTAYNCKPPNCYNVNFQSLWCFWSWTHANYSAQLRLILIYLGLALSWTNENDYNKGSTCKHTKIMFQREDKRKHAHTHMQIRKQIYVIKMERSS